jgi:hypothetical protein
MIEQQRGINEFISIKKQLPEKGKDLIAICTDGEKREVFKCACHNPNCLGWRCSLSGSLMIIKVKTWKYV